MAQPYTLILGNKNYSSWSMRAWLLLKHCKVNFDEKMIDLYTDTSTQEVISLGGETGLVPLLVHQDLVIFDTLAIVETIHETHAGVWPQSTVNRAKARSICNEIHSGLNALRNAMPVNTRARKLKSDITAAVESDILRVQQIIKNCLAGSSGNWLFGEFCVVDIFFAPIMSRFISYDVPIDLITQNYQKQLLAHPLVQQWLLAGEQETTRIEQFD